MVPPMAPLARAVSLGAIGCAGIAYVLHVAHLSRTEAKTDEQELFWDVLLPLASFVLTIIERLRGRSKYRSPTASTPSAW